MGIIYTHYRVLEPAGRTFAKFDILFEHGVSAPNFGSTPVDMFVTGEFEKAVPKINERR